MPNDTTSWVEQRQHVLSGTPQNEVRNLVSKILTFTVADWNMNDWGARISSVTDIVISENTRSGIGPAALGDISALWLSRSTSFTRIVLHHWSVLILWDSWSDVPESRAVNREHAPKTMQDSRAKKSFLSVTDIELALGCNLGLMFMFTARYRCAFWQYSFRRLPCGDFRVCNAQLGHRHQQHTSERKV